MRSGKTSQYNTQSCMRRRMRRVQSNRTTCCEASCQGLSHSKSDSVLAQRALLPRPELWRMLQQRPLEPDHSRSLSQQCNTITDNTNAWTADYCWTWTTHTLQLWCIEISGLKIKHTIDKLIGLSRARKWKKWLWWISKHWGSYIQIHN